MVARPATMVLPKKTAQNDREKTILKEKSKKEHDCTFVFEALFFSHYECMCLRRMIMTAGWGQSSHNHLGKPKCPVVRFGSGYGFWRGGRTQGNQNVLWFGSGMVLVCHSATLRVGWL